MVAASENRLLRVALAGTAGNKQLKENSRLLIER
jgi:hypothetical protein